MLFEDKIAGKCGQTNMVNLNTSIVIFSGVSNLEILIKRIQIVALVIKDTTLKPHVVIWSFLAVLIQTKANILKYFYFHILVFTKFQLSNTLIYGSNINESDQEGICQNMPK